MSTPKRPFGDSKPPPMANEPRRGAPLPLHTQPMIPVEAMEIGGLGDPGQTRVDNPLQTLKPETAAVLFGGKPTISMAAQAKGAIAAALGPPPEIGLTQHHLPDETLDRKSVV